MVPKRPLEENAGRRRWAYGLTDLLVIASCSLVFAAVVAGARNTGPRRAPVEPWTRDTGAPAGPLHHSASHDVRPFAPWAPSRPR